MFSGPYVVINQLIKFIWKATQLENSLLYMLKEKIYLDPTKNDQDWNFWKYGPILVIQKSMVICSWKFLLWFFSIHIFFSIMYHILNPYKKYWDEIRTKNDLNSNAKPRL
jgi:hypothetical protein